MQNDGKGYPAKTAACIDAETLAAWADGGLPNAEAAAVEVHLSDCDRCAAMLATLVRTTPEAPVAESLWQRWHLRWLVPLATAATVGALWVLIPRPQPVPTATLDSAETTQAPAPTPSQPSSAVETKEQEPADARTQSSRASAFEKREAAKAAPPVAQPRARDEARDEFRATAESPAPVAPATPPPAREADRADEKTTGNLQERAALAAPPAAPAAGRAAAPAPAARRPAAEALRGGNTQAFAAVVAQVVVISPDPMTRWRVVGAGQVERSTTGGDQWEPATLPESATLTGGSSPAPSICWLVGRTGAMYVTTDGLRFTRVPFPDRTDFVSIQALDGRRATVVTIDGRTMRTDDQGTTWIRVTP